MGASTILLLIATTTSILLAFTQWRKDCIEADTSLKRKTTNIILFLGIFSCLLAFYVGFTALVDQDKALEDANQYRKKFEAQQNQVILLSKQIRDSTGKTLQGYIKLDKAQTEIIALQNNTIEQITGGKNKPILISSISTYYNDVRKKSYAINFTLANSGKTVLHDINFTLRNVYTGIESFLAFDAEGGFSAKPEGKANTTVSYGGSYLKSDIFETGNNSDNQFSDKNIFKELKLNNLDRTFPNAKNIYSGRMPAGARNYFFVANIDWAYGSYTTKICVTEHDDLTYYRYWRLYDQGVRINDIYRYFNISYPKIPKVLAYCGKVKFDEEVYDVYFNKELSNITLLSRSSIYAQTFSIYKVKNKFESLEVAKKTLKEIFAS